MNVVELYQATLENAHIEADPVQEQVVNALGRLQNDLTQSYQIRQTWLAKVKQCFGKTQSTGKGLYLWGGVGIGKTYLMDMFYQALPFDAKKRQHFHEFMRDVHLQLAELQGQIDPLDKIGRALATSYHVLCFDELFVNDVGDAIILGNLFKALFDNGITLVLTSNVAPENLYLNGVQRELFLPTIDLLQAKMNIIHMETASDYRTRPLTPANCYFFPLTAFVEEKMQEVFSMIAKGPGQQSPVQINGRMIETMAWANHVIWFDFRVICHMPRSQQDYLSIAAQFEYVLISHVPVIVESQDHIITYFINLVDVFYDKGVKLIASAEAPIEALYTAGRKVFEFERTKSRLTEMQTAEYLK